MLDLLLTQLATLATIAISVERSMQIVKKIYLPLRNRILKVDSPDSTPYEKEVLTMLLSVVACILVQCKLEIPGITSPLIVQYILAGLITSLGSNLLHDLMNLILAIRNSYENQNNS